MMVLVFLVAYLDRSNIGLWPENVIEGTISYNTGNAAIAGMNEDLQLTGDKLNVAVTLFYGRQFLDPSMRCLLLTLMQ